MKKCCKRHYDMVITDIQMPEIDGIKLTKQLESIQNIWPGLQSKAPIIACTAHTDNETKEQIMKAGAKHVMYKPVDCKQLT